MGPGTTGKPGSAVDTATVPPGNAAKAEGMSEASGADGGFALARKHLLVYRKNSTFNEADHPRANDGKFGSGGSSTPAAGAGSPSHMIAKAGLKATAAVATFKAGMAKLGNVPVAKQIGQGLGVMKTAAGKFKGALESRYGKKTALAIIASGQVLDVAALGVAHVSFPAASLVWSLPAVAVAETYLQASRLMKKTKALDTADLTPEEMLGIYKREFLAPLLEHFKEWVDGQHFDEGNND